MTAQISAGVRTAMVMAGGTGGHVFPGLAVAEILGARGWQVHWLGNPEGMEAGLVQRAGLPFQPVRFGALRGKGWLALLRLPLNLVRGVTQALESLRRVRPLVVLGMGGYVTVPGGAAARLMGIPLVLHEQNSVAGLANRGLARIASGVIEAFPQAFERAGGGALGRLLSLGFGNSLNARVALLGNPVRGALARLPGPAERADKRHGPLTLLIVGGSLGARALNETVPTALALLAQRLAPEFWPQVVHQSGRAHLEPLRAAYAAAGVQAQVVDFIDDMTQAYSEADLVICRAGAATVAELAVAGVAALLVPYPHAVDDHQTGNARWLTDAGAAWLQPQAQWSAEGLADQLVRLAQPASAEPASAETNSQVVPAGRAELVMMAERARSMAFPDAAERVADFVESLARRLP